MAVSIFSRSLAIAQNSASSSEVCCSWLLHVTEFSRFARHSNFPPFPSNFTAPEQLTQLARQFCLMRYKFVYLIIFFLILLPFRAANLGNPEALIKLGLAHLYNEGSKWLTSVINNKCIVCENSNKFFPYLAVFYRWLVKNRGKYFFSKSKTLKIK